MNIDRTIHRPARSLIAVAAACLASLGCTAGATEAPDASSTPVALGEMHLAFDGDGAGTDVASIAYRVVAADDPYGCDGEPVAEEESSMEAESLPAHLAPEGGMHAFADALFVLEPDAYLVCATPIQEGGQPSEQCAPTQQYATVFPEQTTEILMISQCEGDPNGALDAIAALNTPPRIDDLGIAPSKFITTCESAEISVYASDPESDPLTYEWWVMDSPAGSNPTLEGEGATQVFETDAPGPYEVRVEVSDSHGARTGLRFPIHVSSDDCDAEADADGGVDEDDGEDEDEDEDE